MRGLIATMGEHGHVNPALAVARALVERGVEMAVAVPAPFRAAVEAAGARCLPFTSIFAASRRPLGHAGEHLVDFPTRVVAEGRHVLPQLLALAASWRPDFLAYDKMLLAGTYAGRRLGVPTAILCPTYAEGPAFSVAAARGLPLAPSPAFTATAAALAAEAGAAPCTVEDVFFRAEALNVVCVAPAFQPRCDAFDARYAFVGPVLASAPAPRPPAARQTIYVSLGTVFNGWQELFAVAAAALGGTAWRVVLATGRRDAAAALPAAANVTVTAHARQLEVLSESRVFVTHGGMNSVMEALALGVPLLVIPQMPEQEVTARRVAELGLGLALGRGEVTAARLGEAVETLAAAGGVRAKVEAMQRSCLASGGAGRAAALLINHAGGHHV